MRCAGREIAEGGSGKEKKARSEGQASSSVPLAVATASVRTIQSGRLGGRCG